MSKTKKIAKETTKETTEIKDIQNAGHLKDFLLSVRDRMTDGSVPVQFAVSIMNTLLSSPNTYSMFTAECREIGRDIWLRIKQSGVQIRNPRLLFDEDEVDGIATT